MAIKDGKDPKLIEWSVPSLPRFSAKKGYLISLKNYENQRNEKLMLL